MTQMLIHKSIQLVSFIKMLREEDLFQNRFSRLNKLIISLMFRLLNLKMIKISKCAKNLRKNQINKKIKWRKLRSSKKI